MKVEDVTTIKNIVDGTAGANSKDKKQPYGKEEKKTSKSLLDSRKIIVGRVEP